MLLFNKIPYTNTMFVLTVGSYSSSMQAKGNKCPWLARLHTARHLIESSTISRSTLRSLLYTCLKTVLRNINQLVIGKSGRKIRDC